MNQYTERIRQTRAYLLDQIKDLSLQQLNQVPAGMNNNIAWHFGHMIAAQQGVCYVRAGLKPMITDEFFAKYKPGTQPQSDITAGEWEEMKALSLTTLQKFEADYDTDLFSNYTPWTTRYGVELKNIADTAQFLFFHEGYHSGCISIFKKLVSQ